MKRGVFSAGRACRFEVVRRLSNWAAGVVFLAAFLAAAGTASAAAYVDAGTPDVKPEDRVVVAHPQPVQLLFQFKTKGAPNAQATKFVKQQVIDTVKNSGLFSDVSDAPAANGALLNISIDNVILPKEMRAAEEKGAVTGATLFIAGSNIADHYLCTVDYLGGPQSKQITKTARHALIIQLGLINSPPANAVKVGSTKDAVFTMVRQIVANPLNALAADPDFQSGATASPAGAVETAPQAAPAGTPQTPDGSSQPPSTSAPAPQPAPATTPVPAAAAPAASQ